jgi:hypothetical protein
VYQFDRTPHASSPARCRRSPLHYIHSFAFSPRGGFLAAGNARGKVLLYRLHAYSDV